MWRRWGPRTRRNTTRVIAVAVAVFVGGASHGSGAVVGARPAGATAPARMKPVQPCRVFDSRLSANGARPIRERTVSVRLAGRCGIPADAVAAFVTATVTETARGAGHATVYPADAPLPVASTVNWSRDATTVANGAITAMGRGGVKVRVRGTAHLVVDVSGYFAPAATAREGRFVSLSPRRILDTRTAADRTRFDANVATYGPWNAGTVRRIALPTGVPDDATAVAINLTTTESRGMGHFTVFAAGRSLPRASSLNTDRPGQTRAATVMVPVSARGFMLYSSGGGHVIIDIAGYVTGPSAPQAASGLLVAHRPTRIVDTRGDDPLYARGAINLDTTAVTGAVSATVTNVTMVDTAEASYVAAFPSGGPRPNVSTVNVDEDLSTSANLSITATSASGINYFASSMTHIVVDVTGFFTGVTFPAAGGAPPRNRRPVITQVRTLGFSVQGRPIVAYRRGIPGDTVAVAVAAIHGNELGSVAVADYLRSAAAVPAGVDLWVIPYANPDGAAARRRTNASGVDLNRNFANADWRSVGAGTSRFSGPSAGSEPETRALQEFVSSVQPRLMVWWHQVGNHVDDNRSVARYSLLGLFAAYTGMPIRSTSCYGPCLGTATSFVNRTVAGATSFVVELPAAVDRALARRQGNALLAVARNSDNAR